MFRLIIFIFIFTLTLPLTSFSQAWALAPIAGVKCSQDNLPDGDLQEYELRMNHGSYDVIYRLQKGSMIDSVEAQASEVVVAQDLQCKFGKNTNGLVSCQRKDAAGNVIGYFNTKLNHETYLSSTTGKEYTTDSYVISMSTPELKVHFEEDRYPEDANKSGTIYTDFTGAHACKFQ